jgi:RNA polymerase sigma-70 factor (ECF subfamily)
MQESSANALRSEILVRIVCLSVSNGGSKQKPLYRHLRIAYLMPEVSSFHPQTRSEDATGKEHEASLIERLQKQDVDAFQELIDLHGQSIRNLIGRLMAFDTEMDDVLQNTLVQVWRNMGSFRNHSTLKTWITRIAIMQCRNHQRSVRRWMRRVQERWSLDSNKSRESGFDKNRDDPRWERIQAAMQTLPYRDREILVLFYLQENTIHELAQAMNERVNTLEVRLHRAKKLLKQTIEKGIAPS